MLRSIRCSNIEREEIRGACLFEYQLSSAFDDAIGELCHPRCDWSGIIAPEFTYPLLMYRFVLNLDGVLRGLRSKALDFRMEAVTLLKFFWRKDGIAFDMNGFDHDSLTVEFFVWVAIREVNQREAR